MILIIQKIFDDTLIGIAKNNDNIFSQLTSGGKNSDF